MSDAAATATTDTSSGQSTDQGAGQTAQTTANQTWFGKAEGDDLGYIQNKGWDKEADGSKAVKSYRELEKMVGTIKGDPNRIIVMPKDMNNADEVSAYREKLGIPKSVDDYGFDMTNPDNKAMAELAQKIGLSKEGAHEFVKFATESHERSEVAKAEAWAMESKQEMEAFRVESGKAYDQQIQNARALAMASPYFKENMEAIEKAMGTGNFMRFASELGAKLGEHKAIGLGEGNGNFAMTREQAINKINVFRGDSAKTSALTNPDHPGHKAAMAEYDKLIQFAHGS
jgi:hypothetical protein